MGYIRKGQCVNGSAVIEMSYIMILFLGMFMLIMYGVFYYHDKTVITGAAGETAILGVQAEREKETGYDLEEFFRERTKGKLICMTDIDVSVEKKAKEIMVTVSAEKAFMKLEVCQKAKVVTPEKKIRLMR